MLDEVIIMEMNPPFILKDNEVNIGNLKKKSIEFENKILEVIKVTDSVFITDSVLGKLRMFSIKIGENIKKKHPKTKVFCSLRTVDHGFNSILRFASEAAINGIDGILLIKGDRPDNGIIINNEAPSSILKELKEKIGPNNNQFKFYLSIDSTNSQQNIKNKIAAKPDGFITQLVDNVKSFMHIRKMIPKNIEVIACIMSSSTKNRKSASMLGVKLHEPVQELEFMKGLKEISDGIIVSSPKDYQNGLKLIKKLPPDYFNKFNIIIQSPHDQISVIDNELKDTKIVYEIHSFFKDIFKVLNSMDLVIARSGAGTINDIIISQIPSILVPLPHSIYNHQYVNAKYLFNKNAAELIEEQNLEFDTSYFKFKELIENIDKRIILIKNLQSIKILDANNLMIKKIFE